MVFSRRAVAVCRNNSNQILLVQERNDDYWILPGGKANEGEPFIKACQRELAEELGIWAAQNDLQFQFLFENFFNLDSKNTHELCVGYRHLISDPDLLIKYREVGVPRRIRWVSLNELTAINIRPAGLATLIRSTATYTVFGNPGN